MPRYIDADLQKDNFCAACSTIKRYKRTVDECRNYTDPDGNKCFKMRLIDALPAADVVLRAEFARGIFEEIDKLVDTYLAGDIHTSEFDYLLGELKKKYTEE